MTNAMKKQTAVHPLPYRGVCIGGPLNGEIMRHKESTMTDADGTRYRHFVLFQDIGVWLPKMEDPSQYNVRAAYEQLIATYVNHHRQKARG